MLFCDCGDCGSVAQPATPRTTKNNDVSDLNVRVIKCAFTEKPESNLRTIDRKRHSGNSSAVISNDEMMKADRVDEEAGIVGVFFSPVCESPHTTDDLP